MSTSAALTTHALEKKLKVEAFERARAQWRSGSAHRKASATHYTIAISRESGAAGTEVADEVGRLLKWPVYDRQLLEHIADEAGLRTQLLESLDEKRSHWLMETLQGFGQGSGMTSARNWAVRSGTFAGSPTAPARKRALAMDTRRIRSRQPASVTVHAPAKPGRLN